MNEIKKTTTKAKGKATSAAQKTVKKATNEVVQELKPRKKPVKESAKLVNEKKAARIAKSTTKTACDITDKACRGCAAAVTRACGTIDKPISSEEKREGVARSAGSMTHWMFEKANSMNEDFEHIVDDAVEAIRKFRK